MDESKEMLEQEIERIFADLQLFDAGSKDYGNAISDLNTLYKLKIEETKNTQDSIEKAAKRMSDEAVHVREQEIEKEKMAEQVKDRYVRVGIGVAELVVPLLFYASWMKKGFRFEETGTFTSATFRGLFQKFKPTKK